VSKRTFILVEGAFGDRMKENGKIHKEKIFA